MQQPVLPARRSGAMFGWILKTDWDIDQISRAYAVKKTREASLCLDEEARLL